MRMRRGGIAAGILAALAVLATPAIARDSLGVFDSWGAFRDPAQGRSLQRCYAIAEPTNESGQFRYASVAFWPGARVRAQVHIRMTRAVAAGTPITLDVGGQRFQLTSNGTGAWASDPRMDATIVAAMRSAPGMTVTGGGSSARWTLRGAATAIGAAALGCARR